MTRPGLAGDVGANRQSSRHCKGISGHGIVVGPDGSAVGATASVFGLEGKIVGVVDQARLYRVDRDDRGQVSEESCQEFLITLPWSESLGL